MCVRIWNVIAALHPITRYAHWRGAEGIRGSLVTVERLEADRKSPSFGAWRERSSCMQRSSKRVRSRQGGRAPPSLSQPQPAPGAAACRTESP